MKSCREPFYLELPIELRGEIDVSTAVIQKLDRAEKTGGKRRRRAGEQRPNDETEQSVAYEDFTRSRASFPRPATRAVGSDHTGANRYQFGFPVASADHGLNSI